jgi:hypothetical protein
MFKHLDLLEGEMHHLLICFMTLGVCACVFTYTHIYGYCSLQWQKHFKKILWK